MEGIISLGETDLLTQLEPTNFILCFAESTLKDQSDSLQTSGNPATELQANQAAMLRQCSEIKETPKARKQNKNTFGRIINGETKPKNVTNSDQ